MSNILMLFIFVPILSGILLILNFFLAPHRPDEAKVSAYECGFSPVYGQTRSTFQINFFLVALLFLIFDLEILLLFPIAVTLYHVSVFGFSVVLIFFTVLTIGFILEIGTGSIKLVSEDSLKLSHKKSLFFDKPLITRKKKFFFYFIFPSYIKNIFQSVVKYLKSILYQILVYFIKIIKLHTTFKIKNLFFLIILVILSLSLIWFKVNLLQYSNKYQFYLIIYIILVTIYLIYITFNIGCRVIITLFRGLPFLLRNKKYGLSLGFFLYNSLLILFSFNIMVKLYLDIYSNNENLFREFIFLNTTISMLFLIVYLKLEFKNYKFNINTEVIKGVKEISLCLTIAFLFILCFNQIELNKFSKVLFCKFTSDYSESDNLITDSNKDSSQIINTSINQSKVQDSSTSQGSISSNNTNYLVDSIEAQLTTKLNHSSFWQNILFINSLEGLLPTEELDNRKQLVINKAFDYSAQNIRSFKIGLTANLPLYSEELFKNNFYYPFYFFPVYFNSVHEMYGFSFTNETNLNLIYFYTEEVNLFRVVNRVLNEFIEGAEDENHKYTAIKNITDVINYGENNILNLKPRKIKTFEIDLVDEIIQSINLGKIDLTDLVTEVDADLFKMILVKHENSFDIKGLPKEEVYIVDSYDKAKIIYNNKIKAFKVSWDNYTKSDLGKFIFESAKGALNIHSGQDNIDSYLKKVNIMESKINNLDESKFSTKVIATGKESLQYLKLNLISLKSLKFYLGLIFK